MNLSWFDWSIIVIAVIGLRMVSLSTKKHMKGVADFLSANRSAGRYLLTIASQMGGTAAVSIVGSFEICYSVGFSPLWWIQMNLIVLVAVALTGWVFYRFRETRALTMPQFLEMRYSRRFRVFAGILCWTSGILNFGIFPAVAARFFVYYCGLPDLWHIPGVPLGISMYATVMIIDLALAVTFITMGGQISIMVTECVQGIISCIGFLVIGAVVLLQFKWSDVVAGLSMAPANASMIHPFHTSGDFGVSYFLIGAFATFYGWMSWQGTAGFNCAARTPHEGKMGQIIAGWRDMVKIPMLYMLPIVAYVVLHLPEYSAQAHVINETLARIDNPAIRDQMRVPVALANILPLGIKGLFACMMLFFSFTCHDTYMHSWGSIFIQDVILPLRKKALDPEQHVNWLRWSIIGVAAFSFLFGLFYKPTEQINMFFAITGTIWLGGSGAVIIGGLYWKRGTTAGAYAAVITGAVLGILGLILPKVYESHYGVKFPVNNQWLMLAGMVMGSVVYVVVSLLTGGARRVFDLDRVLHRGRYAIEGAPLPVEHPNRWVRLVGITDEFSRGDRVLATSVVCWNLAWIVLFAVVTAINIVNPLSTAWWAGFWQAFMWIYLAIGVPVTVWFTVGGITDIKLLYRALETSVRDHTDDGRVLSEPAPEEISEKPAAGVAE